MGLPCDAEFAARVAAHLPPGVENLTPDQALVVTTVGRALAVFTSQGHNYVLCGPRRGGKTTLGRALVAAATGWFLRGRRVVVAVYVDAATLRGAACWLSWLAAAAADQGCPGDLAAGDAGDAGGAFAKVNAWAASVDATLFVFLDDVDALFKAPCPACVEAYNFLVHANQDVSVRQRVRFVVCGSAAATRDLCAHGLWGEPASWEVDYPGITSMCRLSPRKCPALSVRGLPSEDPPVAAKAPSADAVKYVQALKQLRGSAAVADLAAAVGAPPLCASFQRAVFALTDQGLLTCPQGTNDPGSDAVGLGPAVVKHK